LKPEDWRAKHVVKKRSKSAKLDRSALDHPLPVMFDTFAKGLKNVENKI